MQFVCRVSEKSYWVDICIPKMLSPRWIHKCSRTPENFGSWNLENARSQKFLGWIFLNSQIKQGFPRCCMDRHCQKLQELELSSGILAKQTPPKDVKIMQIGTNDVLFLYRQEPTALSVGAWPCSHKVAGSGGFVVFQSMINKILWDNFNLRFVLGCQELSVPRDKWVCMCVPRD